MSKIFFTADHHFGHENILTYCPNRKFANIEHHDATLIQVWNERIKPSDWVYHVGDFGFDADYNCFILKRLMGNKVLITGNHDKKTVKNKEFYSYWKKVHNTYHEIEVNFEGKMVLVVLCHYPLATWNKFFHGSFHLHGHVHSTPENQKIPKMKHRKDIGVDSREDCGPWEKNELLIQMTEEGTQECSNNMLGKFLTD